MSVRLWTLASSHSQPSVLRLSYRVVRLSAPCLLHPPQYPVHEPRGHSSHPQPPVRPSKHLFSDSSHRPLESQHRLRVYTPLPPGALKRSSVSFAVDNTLHCSRLSFRERDPDTPSFVLSCGKCQGIVVTADLCGVQPEWYQWKQKRRARER